MQITGGRGVDVALDCTAGAGTIPILLGIEALKRKGGTIVVQGEMKEFPNFPLEKFTVKFITMKSARGHSYRACELALEQLASKRFPLERMMQITGGRDVDVALDCTAGAGTIPILLGIEALKRKGGTIVVQGELAEFPNFPLEKVTVKFITIKSARGHSYKACELALAQLASKRFPLDLVTTHKFGLKDVDLAIRSVGGQGVPDVIHASLMPWE